MNLLNHTHFYNFTHLKKQVVLPEIHKMNEIHKNTVQLSIREVG